MSEQANTTPEFGSQPEDLVSFSEAINAIRTHNDQFSMGKLMVNALVEHLDEAQRAQELVDAGVPQEEAEATVTWVGADKVPLSEEEQMARSVVGVTNAPVLESVGLTLSPLRKTSTMFGPKGEQSVGVVRLQVTDGGKFSSFLLATKPEDVNDDFRKDSASVVSSLVQETSDAIASNEDAQTALETLAYGKGILAGLEHIGLGEASIAQKLGALSEHAQQGDVKEYVLADRVGLLQEAGEQGFGPSQWQKDATAKFLTGRWTDVVNVLKAAKANPKATELFNGLLKSAQASLDYAKADWSKIKAEGYGGGSGYGSGFEDVFQTVGLELSMLASPDEEAK